MEGTVERGGGERGQYRVPIVLMYPDRAPNGFGFVDIVNSAIFAAYKEGEAPGGKRSVYYLGDIIFSDYLRREGFTYLAVQWARMVTYVLGADYGVIEDGGAGTRSSRTRRVFSAIPARWRVPCPSGHPPWTA